MTLDLAEKNDFRWMARELLSRASVPAIAAAKVRTRGWRSPSQMFDIYGYDFRSTSRDAFRRSATTTPVDHRPPPDVQAYLREEPRRLTASCPRRPTRTCGCSATTACGIDGRPQPIKQVKARRDSFRKALRSKDGTAPCIDSKLEHSTTAALAWAIIVESALLNEHLVRDMKETASAKGCVLNSDWLPYFSPNPPDVAKQAFKDYVRCRWPIHVFALDPSVQEQNIADSFTRRREMQMALSLAFVSGKINAQNLTSTPRRIEGQYDTIDLVRTQVSFHGETPSAGVSTRVFKPRHRR